MLSSFSLKSGVFERFWRILSSPFTVLYIRRKTEDPCFERAPVRFFFQNRIAPLSNFAEKRSKDTRFSSYLTIKNPSKRPVASPRRKLKYHSFWKGKMRRKIHTCKWQIVPLISSFFIFYFLFLLLGTVNSELNILQNCSKIRFWGKSDDNMPQVKYFNVYLTLINRHTWRYIVIGETNGKSSTFTIKLGVIGA